MAWWIGIIFSFMYFRYRTIIFQLFFFHINFCTKYFSTAIFHILSKQVSFISTFQGKQYTSISARSELIGVIYQNTHCFSMIYSIILRLLRINFSIFKSGICFMYKDKNHIIRYVLMCVLYHGNAISFHPKLQRSIHQYHKRFNSSCNRIQISNVPEQ